MGRRYVFINGRTVPLIGGGAPEESEDKNDNQEPKEPQNNTQNENSQNTQDQSSQDISQVLKKIEELEKKIENLQNPKTKEEKQEKDELEKKLAELEKFKTAYYQEKIRNAILLNAKDAVDPEVVYDLLKDKAQVTEDGNVLVNGKPVEEAIQELLNKKPYLKKVSQKTGSGAKPKTEEPKQEKSFRDVIRERFFNS